MVDIYNDIFKNVENNKLINLVNYNESEDLYSASFSINSKNYKYMRWNIYDLGKINLLYNIEAIYEITENGTYLLLKDTEITKILRKLKL